MDSLQSSFNSLFEILSNMGFIKLTFIVTSKPLSFHPSLHFSLSPSLSLSLAHCDLQLCPLVCMRKPGCGLCLKPHLKKKKNASVSHSLGKWWGGILCILIGEGTLLYAWLTGRSCQGTPEKLQTLHCEQVRKVWPEASHGLVASVGFWGPLRASIALLCHTGRTCCPEWCDKQDRADMGSNPGCSLSNCWVGVKWSTSLSFRFLPSERRS